MTVRIPSPCHEDWNVMTPNQRGRHCAVCDKTVVDVTRMGPQAGAQYLRRLPSDLAAGAKVCVHAHADARGRLLSPVRRRLLTNGLATVLAVTLAGCTGSGPHVGPAATQQARHQQESPALPTEDPGMRAIEGDVMVPIPGGVIAEPVQSLRGDVCVTPAIEGRVAAPALPMGKQ
ncbi:MAG: hypothetical protein H0V44_14700 [Planctomycetes bacterium]|nr:hypothetical protein [Planctomycetota bacterium]